MSAAPYGRLAKSIPVTVVAGEDAVVRPAVGVAIVRMEPPDHEHADGAPCVACAAHGDVRTLLFDLLERARLGLVPAFEAVVVDARGSDLQTVIDRLVPGRQPAFGLRDHAVARNFHLA